MWSRRWLRFIAGGCALLLLLAAGAWLYVAGIDTRHSGGDPQAQRSDLAWLVDASPAPRGRILAVVSSRERMLDGEGRAGYELTELSRAWWVFEAAGYAVDVASPEGGAAPRVVDDDLVDADYAFLNDPATRAKIDSTQRLDALQAGDYAAVYIVGGKGAMLDLYGSPVLQRLIADIYRNGGVVAAVCHGPAALLGVEIAPGRSLLSGRRVTGFSNAEELFLMEDPVQRLGFLLQDALAAEGEFVEGPMYLENVVQDGRVLSGQNPWSTWALAEATVRAMGAEAAARPRSSEERAVDLLALMARDGGAAARAAKPAMAPVDNYLLLMHAVIAGMQGEAGRAVALLRLARA